MVYKSISKVLRIEKTVYLLSPMHRSIVIKDRTFKPFIKHDEIILQVKKMAEAISEKHKNTFPLFIVILNGSFMFASDLLKEINIACEVTFVKLSSYQGTNSTGKIHELIGLNENLENRKVVIVEDIVDTGNTIVKVVESIANKGAASVEIASIFHKPDVYDKAVKIDYIGFKIPNNFVVGYGLDYDGVGRNLRDLHVLV